MNYTDFLLLNLIILILCPFALSWLAGSDAPYVPTKMNLINDILEKSGLTKNKTFYELGSGDGRVVFAAAKIAKLSIGIEESWIRVLICRYQSHQQKIKNIRFLHANIFKLNFTDADVVYIYLLPRGIEKLEQKLATELKTDSIVITQTYHFQNWKPFKKSGNFWFYKK